MTNWDLNSDRGRQDFANWVGRSIKNEVNSYARQVLGIGNSVKNKMINPSEFIPPSCQIYRTSTGAYTSGNTISYVSSGSTPFYWDTDGMTTTANTITINTPGLYSVTFAGGITSSATALTQVSAYIMRNGTGDALSNAAITSNNLGAYWAYSIIMYLNKNDALTSEVGIVGGSSTQITGSATQNYTQTRFGATWIGKLV